MSGQLTLALIKPHIHFSRNVGKIISEIEAAGFAIILCKETQFLKYGAEEFYEEHKGKPFFDNLVREVTIGPVWALVLAKPNAVEEWRNLIGATHPAEAVEGTIRHKFGDHQNVTRNAVHGSASDHDAQREISFFFSRELQILEEIERLETTGKV